MANSGELREPSRVKFDIEGLFLVLLRDSLYLISQLIVVYDRLQDVVSRVIAVV